MDDTAPIDDTSAPPLEPLNLGGTDSVAPAEPPADTATPGEPTATEPTDPAPAFNVEEYIAGVKVDEGQTYEFNQDLLKEVAPVANELGINPEQLGKLANLMAQREVKDIAERQARQAKSDEERATRVAELDKQVAELNKADPQFAGNVKAAMGLDFMKGSALETLINTTELGHDPVMQQLLAMAGRTVAVDTGVGVNSAPSPAPAFQSWAERWSGGLVK